MSPKTTRDDQKVQPQFEALEPRLLLSASWYPDAASVDVPADDPALPASFDEFRPPVDGQSPVAGAPVFGDWTPTGDPGDVMALTGARFSDRTGDDFGSDTQFFVYAQSTPVDGAMYESPVVRLDSGNLQGAIQLAEGLPDDQMYMIWAENDEGASRPAFVNRTEAWWTGPNSGVTQGDTVSVYGRNLTHYDSTYRGANQSWVYLQPSSGAGQWVEVVGANPYKVDFKIPAGLANGTYEVWVHNGHGGEYGWSQSKEDLTVGDPLPWTSNVIDVTSYGAVGDGVTDDSAAIQAAIDASSDYDQIYFPAGTYLADTTQFTIPANRQVVGDGMDASTLLFERVTLGGNTEVSNLAIEGEQGVRLTGDYVWMDGIRVHETGGTAYNIINLNGKRHVWLQNSELIGNKVLFAAGQTFIHNNDFYARYYTEDMIESWGGSQISITNNTFQHYDTSVGSGWGEGRAWVGYSHFGSHSDEYFGNNETIDFVINPEAGDQNSGEQILYEGSYEFYEGGIAGATANTVALPSDPSETPNGGMRVMIVDGMGIGQVRKVDSWDSGTKTITLTEDWNVTPDAATSVIHLVRTPERVVVYGNRFDGTRLAVEQDAHVASVGVDTFSGGYDFTVDNNVFNEMRTGVGWTANNTRNVKKLVENNTFTYVRRAYGTGDTDGALGASTIFNVFRDNTVEFAYDVAIGIDSVPSGTSPVLTILSDNTVHESHIGLEIIGDQADDLIVFNNDFTRGTAEYAGSLGVAYGAGADVMLRGNTWTGYQQLSSGTNYGAVLETPDRVYELNTTGGGSVQATLPVWNAGTDSLNWSLSDDAPWLSVSPTSGTVADMNSVDELTVTADATGLSDGAYAAQITLTDGSQTMTVGVALTVGDAPTISGYAQTTPVLGSGSVITLNGTGFQNGAAVRIGGDTLATNVNFISSTELEVTLPAMDAADDIYALEVINPNALIDTYSEGVAYGRYVGQVSPARAAKAGGETITVMGAGFESGTTFTINGTAATNVVIVSAREATMTVPASSTVGLADIDAETSSQSFTGEPAFGYYAPFMSEHYTDAGLIALRAKFNDPFYADYAQALTDRANKSLGTQPKDSLDANTSVIDTMLHMYLIEGKAEYRERLMAEVGWVTQTHGWDPKPAEINGGRPTSIAPVYNALAAELTVDERTMLETYLTTVLEDDEGNWGWYGNSGSNTVVYAATAGGMTGMALKHTGHPRAQWAVDWAIDQALNNYLDPGYYSDGVTTEGTLYWDFGLTGYIQLGRAVEAYYGDDFGMLSASKLQENVHYAELMLAGDRLTGMQTFGDTQPFLTGMAIATDLGQRFDQPLFRWLADDMIRRVAEDADGKGTSYYYNNLSVRDRWIVQGFLWRDATPAPAAFPQIPTLSISDNPVGYGAIRTDGVTRYPDMVAAFNGGQTNTHHKQYDAGSYVVQANGEGYLIDPGYFRGYPMDGKQDVHNLPLVDGHGVSDGGRGQIVDSFEETGPTVRGMTMDSTGAYLNNAADRVRRTLAMTQMLDEGEALVLLDDIDPAGAGQVTTQYQAWRDSQIIDSGRGAMITGDNGRFMLRTFGPDVTLDQSLPNDYGNSWYFDRLGIEWRTISGTYQSKVNQPLVTVMLPLDREGATPTAGADFDVVYGSGTVEVHLPGGSVMHFVQNAGVWAYDRTDSPATPTVTVFSQDEQAAENPNDPASFIIHRNGSTSGDLTVNYQLSGSASPADYQETLSGTVVIPDGQASVTITVTPVDETDPEVPEDLTLTVVGGSGYDVGAPAYDTISIDDDDMDIFIWIGGTGSWSASANWDRQEVPGPTDIALFNDNDGGQVNIETEDATVGWVIVESESDFTIAGSYALNLNGGAIDVEALNGVTHTISAKVTGSGEAINFFGGGDYVLSNANNDFVAPVSITDGMFAYNATGDDGVFGDPSNDVTLQNTRFEIGHSGGSWNPPAGRTVTLQGGEVFFYASSDDLIFDDADQLQGDGKLRIKDRTYGTTLAIEAAQPSFDGSFEIDHGYGARRYTLLNPDVDGALNDVPVSVDGSGGVVEYRWGAHLPGGAADGGHEPITAGQAGTIQLTDAWVDTLERFVVEDAGYIRGSLARLSDLTRVSSFTDYASQTAPEVVLKSGAIIALTEETSAAGIGNLGTASDLLFGMGTNFNDAGWSLDVGDGTPWQGLAKQSNAFTRSTSEVPIRLQTGTVTIDSSGGFDEFVLRAAGRYYSGEERLLIGSGSDAPAFTLAGGSTAVALRVLDTEGQGRVVFDSDAIDIDTAFDAVLIGSDTEGGDLTLQHTDALEGLPVTIFGGGDLRPGVVDAVTGDLTVRSGGEVLGAIDLATGRTLAGGGEVTGDLGLGANATMQPGDGVGTLDIGGGLTAADGFTYEWQLGPSGYDRVDVGGDLTLPHSGETWTLKLEDAGGTFIDDYVLFNFDGAASDISGATIDYGTTGWSDLELIVQGNQVMLVNTRPEVTISANDTAAAEAGPDNGQFTVSRDVTDGDLTVYYSVSGDATDASDYQSLSGSVVIPDSQASATIDIVPIDDSEIENDETVTVTLTLDSAYTLGATVEDTVTISSDDVPSVALTATDDQAAELGQDPGTFEVTRSGSGLLTQGDLVVSYTVGGTAGGADYQETLNGSVTIPDGQASATITITPVDDTDIEASESVELTLTSGSGYTLGGSTSDTVLIDDDDFVPGTIYWTGEGADDLASTAANWSGTIGPGVDVVLDGGGANGTSDLIWDVSYSIASWTQTTAYTGTVEITTTYASYDPDFTTLYVTGDVLLEGGTWTHSDNVRGYDATNPDTHRLRVDIGGDFTLGASATIDVDEKGYLKNSPSFNGGGSHGGTGGGSTYPAADWYDSIFAPTLHGVGGGSSSSWQMDGGGSVYLTIAGATTLNGAVSATTGAPVHNYTRAAAGGSVYIQSGSLTGSGDINARGGNSTGGSNTGDGGGGRIALVLTDAGADFTNYTGVVNVEPGVGGQQSNHASGGTAYFQTGNQSSGAGELLVDFNNNNGDLVDDKTTQLTNEDLSETKLTLRDSALVQLRGDRTIGNLDMASGTNLLLDGHTLTIDAAQIDAVLDGTIYLDAARTQTYDPQQGHAQVVFTGVSIPTVTLTANDTSAAEAGPDAGQYTVTRNVTDGDLTVYYSVSGTATDGSDYQSLSGSVLIPDGQASATIDLTPIDDGEIENDETVTLTLSSDAAYTIGSPDSDSVTIADDDVPTVTLTANDATAAEAGPDAGQFTVTRSGTGLVTDGDLLVNYSIGGDGTNGSDYQSLSGSITIPDGQTSATIDVTPIDDGDREADEAVTLTLGTDAAYVVGSPDSDTVVIADDDWTVYWTGDGADSLASTAANWSASLEDGVEIILDGVDTEARKDLEWDVAYNIDSWTQQSAYTGTVTIGTTYASYDATLTTLSVAGDVDLQGGAWTHMPNLYAQAQTDPDTHRLRLDVGGNFVLGVNATIDLISKGYRNGSPGFNGGGSHGGRGEGTHSYSQKTPYDSLFEPTLHGMGSGSTNSWQTEGGGSLYLTVNGQATIDGDILANVTAPYHTWTRAGAGGSVYIEAGSLAGAGAIEARGGDTLGGSNSGGGGGGRIAVVLTDPGADFTAYTGQLNAQPGSHGYFSENAAAGSIYLRGGDQSVGEGELIIDNFNRHGDTVDDHGYKLAGTATADTDLRLRNAGLAVLTSDTSIGELDLATGTNLMLEGHTLTINAAKADCVFDGTIYLDAARSQTYDPQQGHPQVIILDPALPTVSIAANDASASEAGPDAGQYTVTRDDTSGDLTVDYSISGSATNGSDYQSLGGSVTILDGQTSATIDVDPIDDSDVESDETVTLTLSPDAGYNLMPGEQATVTITSDDSGPQIEQGVVTGVSNTGWTTVDLGSSYTSMVVVATANTDSSDAPLVTRVRNASGSSFDLRVDRFDGQTGDITGITIHYMVVQEGVYTDAADGITMEAVRYTSTVTDHDASWSGESRTYSNSYTTPVVVGQVMTYNDADPSAFWTRGSSATNPPDASNLYTGKHVAEDSNTTRSDETIGYVVVEAGSGTVSGLGYVADLGSDSIEGVDNSPPFSYSLSGFASVDSAVASLGGMDGGNGGWAGLYGSSPLSTTDLDLVVDEDQIGDSERSHTTEQVGYIVFGNLAMALDVEVGKTLGSGAVLAGAPDPALVQAAMDSWAAALGRDLDAHFADVRIQVADLAAMGANLLGYEDDGTIYLDDDAAGAGWFIDPTPDEDEEFSLLSRQGLTAGPDSDASGNVDLLTVLRHELGHTLGYGHDDSGSSVMTEALQTGTRKLMRDLNTLADDEAEEDELVDLLNQGAPSLN